ncbi:type 4a pilus biogenesis protein PilO [Limnobacter humi]|uniref:Type 4a pilus biogenesis protein PilO n=1 Tax=Limnobacter humi TaxID=1778671 RepID=A0ABT1WCT2_9BURK|nr:type 4a pilus biogenesis protein PilO [Limnobacter humi]MCQ8895310.1 type 4a pilus biogenesis protein PilO [Limnobacter humi]
MPHPTTDRLAHVWQTIHLLQPRRRRKAVAVTALVLLVLLYVALWRGQLEQSALNQQAIADLVSQLEKQSALLVEQPTIEDELAKLRVEIPALQKSLPDDKELTIFLSRLNATVQGSELKLAEFEPTEAKNLDVMRVVPVKVGVSGSGRAMSRFPNLVASMTRQANLDSFELQWRSTEKSWVLSGVLNAYAQLVPTQDKPESSHDQH